MAAQYLKYERTTALLTVGEIANGRAELATRGVVDLPRVPPRLKRHLLLCAVGSTHLLSGRALGPAQMHRRKPVRTRWGSKNTPMLCSWCTTAK